MPDGSTSMPVVASKRIPIGGPLDLRGTLRPLHGWFAADGWWMTARTPLGAGSLRIRRTREELIGEAWGDGATWLLDRLAAYAGLEDDPSRFITDHPIVADLHHRNPGLRFGRTDLVFNALVVTICAQKVTSTEAQAAMRGLRRHFSGAAPGPDTRLRLPPDPALMADAPYWAYHQAGLEKRRADLLRRVSAAALRIDSLAEVAPAEAAGVLVSIPGIGDWTVAKTLAVSHGDPDQVAVGDFHYKHIVVHHLTGKDRGTDDEMLELLEQFRPQRGRVIRLLHQLGHEPRFGPRLSPRDITGI